MSAQWRAVDADALMGKAPTAGNSRHKKGPAVEGFPSRDGRSMETLEAWPGRPDTDTPTLAGHEFAALSRNPYFAAAKVWPALRYQAINAIMPTMICGT